MRAVDALALLAAQLELPAGLHRDVRLPAIERDDPATVGLGLPPEPFGELPQHHLDAAWSAERGRNAALAQHPDLFVLGAHFPLAARLAAGRDVAHERVPISDDLLRSGPFGLKFRHRARKLADHRSVATQSDSSGDRVWSGLVLSHFEPTAR